MRIADATILLIAGHDDAGADHWLSRWEAKLSTAQAVAFAASDATQRASILEAVRDATRPVVLVAHGSGVFAAVRSAPDLPSGKVKGAFLVAPAGLGPEGISRDPLPFPSALVASRDHPELAYQDLEDLAYAWGGRLLDAGDAGAIDAASGHGPWPEGLMSFAGFLRTL